jgi:hypothetical protein
MATFSSLTPGEQSALKAFSLTHRSNVVAFCKALNNIALADAAWNGNIKAINAKLDVTEVIPDGNNLAGAQDTTQADLLNAMNALETMLGVNNSNIWRGAYAKFVGTPNSMLT